LVAQRGTPRERQKRLNAQLVTALDSWDNDRMTLLLQQGASPTVRGRQGRRH